MRNRRTATDWPFVLAAHCYLNHRAMRWVRLEHLCRSAKVRRVYMSTFINNRWTAELFTTRNVPLTESGGVAAQVHISRQGVAIIRALLASGWDFEKARENMGISECGI